jgi:DNA-directed RNA polymerase specialized sigma24 family protein
VAEAHSRAVELVRAYGAGPEVHARTAELSEEARRAVDQLPAGERDAILLA